MWNKGNLQTLLEGTQIGRTMTENSMELPQKIKNRTTIQSSCPTSGCLSKDYENANSKIYAVYVHSSVIYDSQDIETI